MLSVSVNLISIRSVQSPLTTTRLDTNSRISRLRPIWDIPDTIKAFLISQLFPKYNLDKFCSSSSLPINKCSCSCNDGNSFQTPRNIFLFNKIERRWGLIYLLTRYSFFIHLGISGWSISIDSSIMTG